MATYSISVSVKVHADDDDDAYRTAHEITDHLNSVGDEAAIIDVEEIDE